jgi:hypothetical protein
MYFYQTKENCMKKYLSLLICGILLAGSLLFMACPTGSEEYTETRYSVITETYLRTDSDPNPQTTNQNVGTIAPTPSSGPAGTEVTVAITSKGNYYLDEVIVDDVSRGKNNPVKVTLTDKNITVKAYFKELPAGTYKVIPQLSVGGTISFKIDGETIEYGTEGATVTLSNTPDDGYIFKQYTVDGVSSLTLTDTNLSFSLPAKNVTVSGVFERLADKNLDQLLAAGNDALKAGNFAVAINAYETAYAKDPNNAEALVYSAIGKLASIAWSDQAGNFFKNRLGLKYYPNTLDALINIESWFEYYPGQEVVYSYYDNDRGQYVWWVSKDWYSEEEFNKIYPQGDGYYYYDYTTSSYKFVSKEPRHEYSYQYQPPLNVPDWIKGKAPYTDSLITIDGKSVASSAAWDIILIANLIDKNPTGLNGALDDAINAVFNNPNFTEAVARTAKLKGKDPAALDKAIVDGFGLSELLGDGEKVYVGWAEMELLLSALKVVKATLLYADSYKWDYDIGFVKDLPWDESVLDKIGAASLNKVLPLRTGFMTDRGGSYLEDSRKAYVEALASIIDVYDYYTGADSKLPAGYKHMLEEYQEYRKTVVDAKNAINDKGSFTVEGVTINFGKFFTPGQLALDKLIETEGSGTAKSPVFYGRNGNGTPVKIGSLNDIKKGYDAIGVKVSTVPVGEIVGDDLAEYILEESGFAEFVNGNGYLFFDSMSGTIAWAVYHWSDDVKEYLDF